MSLSKKIRGFFTKSMENRPDEMASCGNYPTISYIEKARQWGSFLHRNDMMVPPFSLPFERLRNLPKDRVFFL